MIPPTSECPPAPGPGLRRWLPGLAGLLLALVCFVAHRHTINFDFVLLDDDVNILFNPHLGDPTPERLYWMWTDMGHVRRYMPLGWLGLSLIYSGTGLDPAGFHLALVSVHAANALLLFLLLYRLLCHVRPSADEGRTWLVVTAWLMAAAWAFHPLGVEIIAWSSGWLYGQAIFFCLAAVLVYLELAWGPPRKSTSRNVGWLVAWVLYACSLLTYPPAIGVMPGLLFVEYCRGGRVWPGRRFLLERSGFVLASILILAVTVYSRYNASAEWSAGAETGQTPLPERFVRAAYVLGYYVWRPWAPFDLSPVYTSLLSINPLAPRFLASGLAVWLVGGAGLLWPRFRRTAGPWLLAYVVIMFPFLGLTEQIHITYDRYALLPMALFAAVGAVGLAGLRLQLRGLAAGLAGAVILGWALASHRQTWVWENSIALHTHIAGKLQAAEFPLFKYRRTAFVLMSYGQTADAVALLARGRALFPDDPFLAQSARDLDTRLAYYRNQGTDGPRHILPLAIQHVEAGLKRVRRQEWREAAEHFRSALVLSPRYFNAAYNRALSLLPLGELEEALTDYDLAAAEAGVELSAVHRRAFLSQLAAAARVSGKPRLAAEADRRLSALE